MTYSAIAKQLFERYQEYIGEIKSRYSASNAITVNEAVGSAAFAYEKLRTVIDFKDEQLLKKDAIKRMLARRFRRDMVPEKTAQLMIRELIRSRYLPNNRVAESEIFRVAQVLEKYHRIFLIGSENRSTRERAALREWLIQVAAVEVDDAIFVRIREQALVDAMYQKIVDQIAVPQRLASESDRKLQIYIATQRALLKADGDMIKYRLLKLYYPTWNTPDPEQVDQIARNFQPIIDKIEHQIDYPLRNRILNVVRKYAPPFLILRDILEEDPVNVEQKLLEFPQSKHASHGFDAPVKQTFDEYLTAKIEKKYKDIRSRLRKRSFRAVIYLLITKVALTVILEVPYDLAFEGQIHWNVVAINLIFHPLFVLIVALIVRPPGKKNTEAILQGVREILFEGTNPYVYTAKRITIAKRNVISRLVFTLFYAGLFFVTYGAIGYALYRLDFNLVSGGIFVVLFSTVSFFAVALRYNVKEYIVARTRQGFLGFLIDLFSLPIIMAGRWISVNFSRVNVFVFILDVIIEAPFQTIISLVEDWLGFVREKREEVL